MRFPSKCPIELKKYKSESDTTMEWRGGGSAKASKQTCVIIMQAHVARYRASSETIIFAQLQITISVQNVKQPVAIFLKGVSRGSCDLKGDRRLGSTGVGAAVETS